MATKVIMPQLGESVVEGTVSRWLRQVGETINEYDSLLEVSTDKVDSEIPSPASGTILEIYVPEGETVKAGTVLCVIGNPGEKAESAPVAGGHGVHNNGNHGTSVAAPEESREQGGTRISPVVARMAAEHQIDLNRIKGTGMGGRVTKKDVEAYLQQGGAPAPTKEKDPWDTYGDGDLFKPRETPPDLVKQQQATNPTPNTGRGATTAPQAPARVIPVEAIPQGAPGELVQLSNMRRSIADHMVRSKLHTAPHVTTVFEVDLSNVLKHLDATKPTYAKQGVNLTLTAYFVQATVMASAAVPMLNSQWTDEGIYLHHAVHVGMAVAIADGLIVPVIKNAQELNLLGTARQVNDLAQRARNKQLKPDEIQGGTITISNHGVSGSLFATPIINQPQSAIIGVGMMEKRVKVINDAIAIRPCCYISLTFDHRVADGASGDAWMMALKKTLENWGAE